MFNRLKVSARFWWNMLNPFHGRKTVTVSRETGRIIDDGIELLRSGGFSAFRDTKKR